MILSEHKDMVSKRKVYAASMNYDVPDAEKDQASKVLIYLDHLLKIMRVCSEHLDLMYTPFKDNQNISPEQTFAARAALRRYRDKVVDNFNILKTQSFKCFVLMQPFSVDTQVLKLSKSFVLAVSDLEKQVNRFVDLFSNMESKDFGQSMVKAIENIKKEMAQLEQIIEDRMKSHLQKNILARNWVDDVSGKLQEKVEQKIPLSLQLVEERNKGK
jgi:hypothetical protein